MTPSPYIWPGMARQQRKRFLPSPVQIIDAVCKQYGITPEQITLRSRIDRIVEARQVAMYILYKKLYPAYSLKDVGGLFGGFDHTTVLSNCNRIQDLIDTEPDFKAMIETLLDT